MQHSAPSGCRPNQAPAEFRLSSSSGVGLGSNRFRSMAADDPELTCGNRFWLPRGGRPAQSGSRVWGPAAIDVVGSVAGCMLGKLDKPKKRKPPSRDFRLVSLHGRFSLCGWWREELHR